MRPRNPTMPSETVLKVSVNLSQRLTSKFVSVLMVHLSICRSRLSARKAPCERLAAHGAVSKVSLSFHADLVNMDRRFARRATEISRRLSVPIQYMEREKAIPRLLDK